MRLQKKPLVLVASVPTRGGPTCTIFLMDIHRASDIHNCSANTCGRTRRSAPTRSFLASASPVNNRQAQTWQRVARWNVEREGREPKVMHSSSVVPVGTGDFGTNARHPPRQRTP
jgi:hypothetical protein